MTFPEELLYTADHEWVKVEGEVATVGITDFAQGELGDIVYLEVETVGQELGQHAIFGTVEAVKTVSDLFLPIQATIMEKNEALDANPELINTDPYGQGWIVKVKISEAAQLNSLLNAEAYRKTIGQ